MENNKEVEILIKRIDNMINEDEYKIEKTTYIDEEKEFENTAKIIQTFSKSDGQLELSLKEEEDYKLLKFKYNDEINPTIEKKHDFKSIDFYGWFTNRIVFESVDENTKLKNIGKNELEIIINENYKIKMNFKSIEKRDNFSKIVIKKVIEYKKGKSYVKKETGFTSAAVLALVASIAGLAFTVGILVGVN